MRTIHVAVIASAAFLGLAASLRAAPAPARGRPNGLFTDEQIAQFKTEWKDEKKGETLQLVTSFGPAPVEAKDRGRYARSGKIPVRITVSLYEVKQDRSGKDLRRRLDGTGSFYVLDSEGNAVFRESMSLSKLCPS